MGSAKKVKSKRSHHEIDADENNDPSIKKHKRHSNKKEKSSKHKTKKSSHSKKEKKSKKSRKSDDKDKINEDEPFVGFYQYSKTIELEHAVAKFVEAYKVIVDLSPNFKTFSLNEMNQGKIDFQLVPSFSRYQLKFASELKTLHELNKAVDLSKIETYEEKYTKGNKQPILEEVKDIDLDSLPLSKPISSADSQNITTSAEILLDEENGLNSSDEVWPPKLLPINDLALKSRVFTHKSMVNNKLFLSDKQMMNTHNERLEFLGDSVLNTLTTMFIYKMFPSYDEGQLTKLRIALVNNQKLKEYAEAYGMEKFLSSSINHENDKKYYGGKQKVTADIFEAYIGALVQDKTHTLDEIQEWLKRIAMPTIKNSLKSNDGLFKENDDFDVNAKRRLYSLIGYAALNLHYEVIKRPTAGDPLTTVACKVGEGITLGLGSAKNTKLAGIKAAENVLSKKDVIEKYANQRAAIPRTESSFKDGDNKTGEKIKGSIGFGANGELRLL
ncbi:hypothetical protein C6P45_002716 [Maudiozyma exigua]|uniref:ribonuclease III n=1 Tax=Maudiozyma exigua TaxID=34358 RepID=A0A9P6VVS2_MAUEX|nr:hypothetical protein C6P45_002716 [Kazachstania exigua]